MSPCRDQLRRGFLLCVIGEHSSRALAFPEFAGADRLSRNPAGFSFAERGILIGASQDNAFGCGRHNPRGKSSGPPLLEPSLKVKRNNAHGQSSTFKVAPVLGHLNARAPLKVRLDRAVSKKTAPARGYMLGPSSSDAKCGISIRSYLPSHPG